MNSYLERYAKIYDVFYQNKPYCQEANFVNSCLMRFKDGPMHSLLELGCGTGSHALELEKYGYDILATDYSESMLSIARQKANTLSSKVNFKQQDMRSLSAMDVSFDAVVCLFDSIGYVLTNHALMQTLQGINSALRTTGLLILEFWHGVTMLRHYEPLRISCLKIPTGELLRISETTLDYYNQVGKVNYTFYELNNSRKCSIFHETHLNRYFFIQEMAAYLSLNGFTPLKFFAGFSESEAITEDTWHILALARKSK